MIQELQFNKDEINYIAHIADIHIRPYKRHAEYNLIFDKLYESLRTKNPDLILLAGDIVHSKNEMTPELIDIVSNFFKNLSKIAKTIIVPGNHDMLLNNLNRLDALTPIINNLNNDNIIYIKNTGIYKIADINLINMSVIDENYTILDTNELKDLKHKIGIYHGVVNGSENDLGFKFTSDMTTDKFNLFDIVMLGDIHKRQFLNDEKTIAFCGSLIQQNFGESVDKGYLFWDVKHKKCEEIIIHNDYSYYTLEIKDNKVPNIENISKKCKLRLKVFNSNQSELNTIVTEVRKMYKPSEIIINRISDNIIQYDDSMGLNTFNVSDINYQNQLLKEYINNNFNVPEDMLQKILLKNEEINSLIQKEDILRNVRWNISEFKWSNMFSYGKDNYINFKNMKGVYGIFAPNAYGKSSFIDSLVFCLFDKTTRESKVNNIMNKRTDSLNCEVSFDFNSEVYRVVRDAKLDKNNKIIYKTDFYSTDNNNNNKKDLKGKDRWATNNNIRSIIGEFDHFILSSYSIQDNNNGIIDSGNSSRKDLIIEFIGLGIYDKLSEKSSKLLNIKENMIKVYESENLIEKLDNFKNLLIQEDKKYKSLKTQLSEKEEEINNVQQQIDELKSKIIKIEQSYDIEILNKDKTNLIENIKTYNDSLSLYTIKQNEIELEIQKINNDIITSESNNINKEYEYYNKLLNEKNIIENKFSLLKNDINNMLEKIKKLGKLEYDENCKYCMNNIFVKDAIETKSKLEEQKVNYINIKNEINKLDNEILSKKNIQNEFNEYNKNKNELIKKYSESTVITSKINSISSNINITNDKIASKDREIELYYKNEEIIKNNKKVNDQIYSIKIIFDNLKDDKKAIDKNILVTFSQINLYSASIKDYEKKIEEFNILLEEYDIYKYYTDSIKRNGIPYEVILKVIPTIENEVNNILSQIVDFSIRISLDDNKNINISINYGGEELWPLEMGSGMEKFISSTALRVALTNISSIPKPNFLIIDEGWGKLDSENLNSVNLLLDYLKCHFDIVIIISHINELKSLVDYSIEIKRDSSNNSQIYYNI